MSEEDGGIATAKDWGLIRCPFCGGPGRVVELLNDHTHSADCQNCGAGPLVSFPTPEEAVAHWNTRASLSQRDEAREQPAYEQGSDKEG
jgi:hypothetical protein